MAKLVYDVETNDKIMANVHSMWTMVIHNRATGERLEFLEGDLGWIDYFNEHGDVIIGHNILSYDNIVLLKLFNFEFKKGTVFHDTLLMSQILDYRRFGYKGHALAAWGEHLGYPKIDFDPSLFDKGYTEEMGKYCHQDVNLNDVVYTELLVEFKALMKLNPRIKPYMQAEHYAARWQAAAEYHGWPFDKDGALALFDTLDKELTDIRNKLESKLGKKAKIKDKVPHIHAGATKEPAWVKSGAYNVHTVSWFGFSPLCGHDLSEDEALGILDEFEDDHPLYAIALAILDHGCRPILGPFCRVEFPDLSLSSPDDVKIFLFRNGWVPTEFNYKKDENGKYVRDAAKQLITTSPKITDDSLNMLGKDGMLYRDFTTSESRYGIVRGWLENVDDDDLLHGDSMLIGTPSMRTRHKIIVNVPSGEREDDGTPVSRWGPEMRNLFRVKPGWKAIGCDSAGNQARGLAHYLEDEEYIDIILNGDIHSYNAEKMTLALAQMGIDHKVPRNRAKRVLYAFLFGASGKLLWSYIFDKQDVTQGNKFKKLFISAVPGFEMLIAKLTTVFKQTSKYGFGYIPSICGNKIYVDSLHKLLVYLLQSLEKITCSTAVMFTMQQLEKEGIPYQPLIYYHDEEDFMVPEEYAERAGEIGASAFKEGPKLYGIEIMDGDAKIGDTWLDIH